MGKYVLGLVFILGMMSCGQDIDIFIPRTGPEVGGDINRLTSKLKQDIAGDIHYTISCNCFGDQAFEIDKDLILQVPANFIDVTKYPCLNGSYTLDVTVCDSRGEIMIAGIPTLSENTLLESRIEFNLQISNGEQNVELAEGKKIRVLVRDPDPRERMELFYGDQDEQTWIQADGNPDTWSNVIAAEFWIQQDSTPISGFGYEAFSDSLDWINVDQFVNIPQEQRTAVCVELPEEYSNTNTQVFIAFKDYKSIILLDGDSTKMQFCEGHQATPLGFRATIIVMADRGEDNYYFASKETIITPNMTEYIVPKRTPYEEISNYLRHL